MLLFVLNLLYEFPEKAPGFLNVFRYLTVRAAGALFLAFFISLLIGPRVIAILRALKAGQVIRKAVSAHAISLDDMHGQKKGTPTMGGILILISLLAPVLLFCRLNSLHLWLVLLMSVGFGLLGFWDDYLKVHMKNHKGASPRMKLGIQALLGFALGSILTLAPWSEIVYTKVTTEPGVTETIRGYTHLTIPFLKNLYPDLGLFYIPFVMIVLLATSNAVNLTDGLDGLAIGTTFSNALAFLVVAYLVTRADFSSYLYVPYINGGEELFVFLAALIGASMGFLWFNAHPAAVFMGDTGSMMLGGALGTTAILLKQEFLLVVIGGIFVIEALSVIIQVASFQLRGKRVFLMSPIHHHFERKGIHESQIIIRFWLVSWLLAMAGLAMLKLR